MAVGDIVSGLGAIASSLTFQPAATVNIILTAVGSYNSWSFLFNGTSKAHMTYPGATWDGGNSNCKIGIDNTNYVYFDAPTLAGYAAGYTGIQIK